MFALHPNCKNAAGKNYALLPQKAFRSEKADVLCMHEGFLICMYSIYTYGCLTVLAKAAVVGAITHLSARLDANDRRSTVIVFVSSSGCAGALPWSMDPWHGKQTSRISPKIAI